MGGSWSLIIFLPKTRLHEQRRCSQKSLRPHLTGSHGKPASVGAGASVWQTHTSHKTPPNGLLAYCGTTVAKKREESQCDFEPFRPTASSVIVWQLPQRLLGTALGGSSLGLCNRWQCCSLPHSRELEVQCEFSDSLGGQKAGSEVKSCLLSAHHCKLNKPRWKQQRRDKGIQPDMFDQR